MPQNGHTRREFCTHACVAGAATLLAACSNGSGTSTDIGTALPVVAGTRVNGLTTVIVDANSPLNAVSGMALVQASGANFLATRTSQDACSVVTANCTHQACIVSNASSGVYTCPCHGSQFDPSGRVVRGPAATPLQAFTSALFNGVLTING
jgi:nitrite reductase/ring-hydroxylating ferredoxin subunit